MLRLSGEKAIALAGTEVMHPRTEAPVFASKIWMPPPPAIASRDPSGESAKLVTS